MSEEGAQDGSDTTSDNPPASANTPFDAPQAPGFADPQATSFAGGFTPAPATLPTIPTSFSNSLPDPNAAIRAASQMPPVPYTPDPNPGGFVPYDPSQQPQPIPPANLCGDSSSSLHQLSPDQVSKAQKYCKWASSALNYDDVKTAINNLKSALELLQTGRDPAWIVELCEAHYLFVRLGLSSEQNLNTG